MIERLGLRNFRQFQQEDLDLRDFNLLIGANNTGKSAVLYAIDLLYNNFHADFSFNRASRNLGTLQDNTYNRTKKGKIRFKVKMSIPKSISNNLRQSFKHVNPNIWPKETESVDVIVDIPIEENIPTDNDLVYNSTLKINGAEVISGSLEGKDNPTPFAKDFNIHSISRTFPIPLAGNQEHRKPFLQLVNYIKEYNQNRYFYLFPERLQKQRVRSIGNTRRHDVGSKGDYVTDVMAYNRDEEELEENYNKVREWINRFGFDNILPRLIEGERYSLELEDKTTGVKSNVEDIGSGTNQLLTIIIQSYFAPENSLLLIEEPDAFLHPKFQAKLTDFFIDAISFGNHRFIIETHSEHLLLRLQRRIAEDEISPESVGLFFFEKKSDGSTIRQIEIDGNGDFEGELSDFFVQDFKEVNERMKAISDKNQIDE